ncbi:MAG TPA: endonuclease III domain-containing protein [Deltaproteobacteria bacterium]|nr:endonuclease III domain-containing protein [Deltaproteobacteria bacterium]
MRKEAKILKSMYEAMLRSFGPQGWWPADTPFEVVVGAILTQNTNWANVEKSIENLKAQGVLSPEALHRMSIHELARLIKPSGYFNIKAKRLKAFLNHLFDNYGGRLEEMFKKRTDHLREELLSINGIGEETADSIVLYAAEKPLFVVDAYTKRILSRHGLTGKDATYGDIQRLFMENLPHHAELFNEYHALLVRVGKEFCKKTHPLCTRCPLKEFLPHGKEDSRTSSRP